MHSPTLFVLAAILLGMVAAALWAVSRFNPDIPGLKQWRRAYACGFLFCVSFLWARESPTVVSIMLAQAGMLLMAYLCMRGCLAYVGQAHWARWRVRLLIGALLMLALFFTVGRPDLRARMLLGSLGPAVFYLIAARVMLRHAGSAYPARQLFGWVCGVHGLFLVVRPLLFNMAATKVEVVTASVLIESIVALNVMGFCILLLVNEHVTTALRRLAEIDSLTGVFNHRTFMTLMEKAMSVAERAKLGLPVMLLDLDHFKQVNDTWGHQLGDEVLRHFVDVAEACLRKGDVMGRLGGEEFALFLPHTSYEDACLVAERLREQVETQPLHTPRGAIRLSVSIGVTVCGLGESPELALVRADQAMYRAKGGGRNRVEATVATPHAAFSPVAAP